MGPLDDLQAAVQEVARRAGASVVGVRHGWGAGSGVVIAEGKVLTNAHNLRGDEIELALPGGRSVPGRVSGVDVDGDLAVISADTERAAPVSWNEGELELPVGAPVFALANPGGRGLRVTFGLVSATAREFRGPRGRRIKGSIEHTAPLSRGSSGGPITDRSGGLLGLNTNRLGEGFYLAIPADESLRAKVDALSRGESRARPRIGIGVAPAHVSRHLRRAVGLPDREGVLIRAVQDESPASRAGLAEGDLITRAGGRPILEVDDLYEALESVAPGAAVELLVLRGAEERTVSVATTNGGEA